GPESRKPTERRRDGQSHVGNSKRSTSARRFAPGKAATFYLPIFSRSRGINGRRIRQSIQTRRSSISTDLRRRRGACGSAARAALSRSGASARNRRSGRECVGRREIKIEERRPETPPVRRHAEFLPAT